MDSRYPHPYLLWSGTMHCHRNFQMECSRIEFLELPPTWTHLQPPNQVHWSALCVLKCTRLHICIQLCNSSYHWNLKCIEVCISVCACVCCVCLCVCVYVSTVCVCICLCMRVCMYVSVSAYVWVYACSTEFVYVYVCMCLWRRGWSSGRCWLSLAATAPGKWRVRVRHKSFDRTLSLGESLCVPLAITLRYSSFSLCVYIFLSYNLKFEAGKVQRSWEFGGECWRYHAGAHHNEGYEAVSVTAAAVQCPECPVTCTEPRWSEESRNREAKSCGEPATATWLPVSGQLTYSVQTTVKTLASYLLIKEVDCSGCYCWGCWNAYHEFQDASCIQRWYGWYYRCYSYRYHCYSWCRLLCTTFWKPGAEWTVHGSYCFFMFPGEGRITVSSMPFPEQYPRYCNNGKQGHSQEPCNDSKQRCSQEPDDHNRDISRPEHC